MEKLGAVLGALVLVLLGAGPARAEDPGTITSYVSDYTVSPDGDLTAVETITVDFPDPRHGIFRTFVPPDNQQILALPPRRAVTATRDGEPVTTTVEEHGQGFLVRLGDPDVEITGEHVYEIRFTVAGAVVAGDDEYDGEHHPFTEFYWDTIGADWELPILSSEVTVHLPGRATDGSCGAGFGETDECDGVGTSTISYQTGRLEPGTPVSVRTDYVVGEGVDDAADDRTAAAEPATRADAESEDGGPPLGVTTGELVVAAVPAVLVAVGAGYYVVRRRSRVAAAWTQRTPRKD